MKKFGKKLLKKLRKARAKLAGADAATRAAKVEELVLRPIPHPAPSAEEVEIEIVEHESGVSPDLAARLVSIGERSRNLKGHGLDEGLSTRMLIYAGSLIAQGVEPIAAGSVALVRPVTDDPDIRDALDAAVKTFF